MKIGMYLDLRNPPEWPRPWPGHYGRWLERAEEAERLGAASVWLSEHHFFDDGYLPQTLTFAAALAARTRRVRIGTAVLLLPLHAPVEIAEQAAMVDVLSDGRLDLGMGVGYRKPEYVAFGGNFKRRFSEFERRVHELRQWWGEEDGAPWVATPAPVQRPMPLWFGFFGPQGARLAGRLGGGLLATTPDVLEPYRAGLAEGGHEPASARMAGVMEFFLADDPEAAWARAKEHVVHRWNSYNRYAVEATRQPPPPPLDPEEFRRRGRTLVGTPQEVAAAIKERTAGLPVEQVYGWSDFPGLADDLVDRHIELTFGTLAPLLADA